MNPKPSFVVFGGDATQYGDLYNWTNFRVAMDTLTMPYFICLGNHDDSTKATNGVSSFGDLFPEWGAGQFYYYRDIDNIRVIILETGQVGYQGIASNQMAWLNATLNTDKSVFVFHHFPMQFWTWEAANQRDIIKASYVHQGNVIADFNGHLHSDWTTVEDGILYRGVGSFIRYPVNYGIIDVYGTHIDSQMAQVLNRRYLVNNQGMTDTEHYSTIDFSFASGGMYQGVNQVYNNTGLVHDYDRPVLGHTYIAPNHLSAQVTGLTSGNLSVGMTSWAADHFAFTANATSGNAIIQISGVTPHSVCTVYVDGAYYADINVNGTGILVVPYSGPWSEHSFSVVVQEIYVFDFQIVAWGLVWIAIFAIVFLFLITIGALPKGKGE
jgi:hypothetical protein